MFISRPIFAAVSVVSPLVALQGTVLAAPPAPAETILRGVTTIAAPGTPGSLAVWARDSAILAVGRDDDHEVPVAAAGVWPSGGGTGRVVALVHTGMLDAGSGKIGQTSAMIAGAIRWAANSDAAEKPVRVALLNCNLNDLCAAEGFAARKLDGAWEGSLSRANTDVLCIVGNAISPKQIERIEAFLQAGGGVVAAQTAWAWNAPAGKTILDNPLNRIFAPAGIAWTQGYSGKSNDEGFAATAQPEPLLNAMNAVDYLVADAAQPKAENAKPTAELKRAAATATAAARLLPAGDTLLRPRLAALLQEKASDLVPTPKQPLKENAALLRTLLALQLSDMAALPAAQVKAHPAAAVFPGAVAKEAKRITRALEVNTGVPEWHSTGLYAAAGEVVTIEVPGAATKAKLQVRIGCHEDHLYHHAKWERVPEITREWTITGETTDIASAFGGPIYIDVPGKCGLGTIKVTIKNAVAAPLFVLGVTTAEEWKINQRDNPAPWAELASEKVILSVPSSAIRTLEDPAALMKTWNEILDAAADLATIPRERARPERYTADQQISAGYMHSGYPIMTHLDAADDMTHAEKLRAGTWGLFHELGHNHQAPEWTFDGTGEVTVNLFSLYIMETVCGKAMNSGHGALGERERLIAKHKSKGWTFDHWKSDPFLALIMYQQLREAFGWETYKKVFAEYRALPKAERPKNNEEERDQWMVRFSRATGKNLGPFFEAWGVPTSDAARASIAELPRWMPEGFSGK